ncbi:hypothetical protein WME99_31725 [Sorangium sp. So ce136]|uniref:hypothetical protein n=1 Tax=Sorangium sp. So ce136 TaxID=3133284 RepID=UPI003F00E2C0
MRRYVMLAAAVSPLLAAAAAVTVPGCGEEFENICAFLQDPNSCYADFHRDFADKCGALSVGSGPKGSFASRETLDVCFLEEGGQVVFDPPLDIAAFPPKTIAFKIMDAQAEECGAFTYSGEFTYSVSLACNQADKDAGVESCADVGVADDGTVIMHGTVTVNAPEGRDTLDVSCADSSSHHFNRIDAEKKCGEYAQLLPRAVIKTSLGTQPPPDAGPVAPEGFEGFISFSIHYPPRHALLDGERDVLARSKAEVVKYFHCEFPPSPALCFNGVKDGPETDIDCGGTLCDGRCGDGQLCVQDRDCGAGLECGIVDGFRKCQKVETGAGGAGGTGGTEGTAGAGGQ